MSAQDFQLDTLIAMAASANTAPPSAPADQFIEATAEKLASVSLFSKRAIDAKSIIAISARVMPRDVASFVNAIKKNMTPEQRAQAMSDYKSKSTEAAFPDAVNAIKAGAAYSITLANGTKVDVPAPSAAPAAKTTPSIVTLRKGATAAAYKPRAEAKYEAAATRRANFLTWLAAHTRDITQAKTAAVHLKAVSEYTSEDSKSDASYASFMALVEQLDVSAGQEYLESKYHASNALLAEESKAGNLLKAVSSHIERGMEAKAAALLEVTRISIGFYQLCRAHPNIKQAGEWMADATQAIKPEAKAGVEAAMKENSQVVAALVAGAPEIWVVALLTMVKTGHHYLSQFNATHVKTAAVLGFASMDPAMIWHSAIHPIDMRALQPAIVAIAEFAADRFAKPETATNQLLNSMNTVVLKRIQATPASWGWLSLVVRVYRQIRAMRYGKAIDAVYGPLYVAGLSLLSYVCERPESFASSAGLRGMDFDTLAAQPSGAEVDKIVGWRDVIYLVPICAAWIAVYASAEKSRNKHMAALAKSQALGNRSGDMVGAQLEWQHAFRAARLAIGQSVEELVATSAKELTASGVKTINAPQKPLIEEVTEEPEAAAAGAVVVAGPAASAV